MNLFEVCDPLTLLDSYKLAHREQYGPKVEYIYSNWTPRSSRLEGVDKVVFFGLQYFLKEYLGSYWDKFFYGNIDSICEEYERKIQLHLGSKPDTQHLRDLHKLGYLPLEFKALPEGTEVPLRVPMFTVENTNPKFAWLVNYIESILSNVVWLPCTSATIALRLRKLLNKRAIESGLDESAVDFQGHDFSFRGMKGLEAAVLSGAGHLLSFKGSDTVPAIDFLEYYYGAEGFIAGSVPASEHSSSTLDGPENELETYRRFISLYPKGFVSLVADSYDYWSVLTNMMPVLKEQIMNRDGRVVIRPDSGDPVKVVIGDKNAPEGSPEYKGSIELLWEVFGGTYTSNGLKLLDSHIGLIYGDAITYERADEITKGLIAKGFASTNIVFGVGSYTYSYVTRDTFGFAFKTTGAVVDGVERAVFKDPKTDNGIKKSLRGFISVRKNEDGKLVAIDQLSREESSRDSLLEVVWKNGVLLKDWTFEQVKENLNATS